MTFVGSNPRLLDDAATIVDTLAVELDASQRRLAALVSLAKRRASSQAYGRLIELATQVGAGADTARAGIETLRTQALQQRGRTGGASQQGGRSDGACPPSGKTRAPRQRSSSVRGTDAYTPAVRNELGEVLAKPTVMVDFKWDRRTDKVLEAHIKSATGHPLVAGLDYKVEYPNGKEFQRYSEDHPITGKQSGWQTAVKITFEQASKLSTEVGLSVINGKDAREVLDKCVIEGFLVVRDRNGVQDAMIIVNETNACDPWRGMRTPLGTGNPRR